MCAILERLYCKQASNEHFGSDAAEEGMVGRLVWYTYHVQSVFSLCARVPGYVD